MILIISLSMLGVLVVLGMAYAVLAPRWQEAQVLQQRFQQWEKAQSVEEHPDLRQVHILSNIPWLDAILRRIPLFVRFEHLRKQAGTTVSLGTWILASGLLGSCFYLALSQSFHPPLFMSLGVAGLGFALPLFFLKFQKSQRIRMFQEQFPEALDMLTRTIQAGHSLVLGMQLVGEEFKDPLGAEFKRTIEEVQRWGIPFQEALQRLPERIESLDLKYFAIAVIIQREAGGNLTEILESLSDLIRKRFELKDRVKALSAEGKMSAIILFALPFVIAIAMSVLNPAYLRPLFTTETGTFLVGVGLAMMSVGGFVTRKMIAFKV